MIARQIRPQYTPAKRVAAPAVKLSMERVSEAEQGSEVVRAEPMLAMPTAKVSWLRLSGSPVLALRVLLITVCSSVERKAIPTMTGKSSLM